MNLLSVNADAKTKKGVKQGILTGILYMAPADLGGFEVCKYRTPGCSVACLYTAGRGRFTATQAARLRRKDLFFKDRSKFWAVLIKDIKDLVKKADAGDLDPAVRLNGTSDLSPVLFKHEGKTLMEIFPEIQFYDYTKVDNRVKVMEQYPNYDLTFSYTGYNWSECETMLENNVRVAVIFDVKAGKPLPKTFNGYEVIDGDLTDYRPLDDKGVIVGLRYKHVANEKNLDLANSVFVVSTHQNTLVV
jgi:hypothetical protein